MTIFLYLCGKFIAVANSLLMKLKFTIQYGTQWGENLYVCITYRSNDGTEKFNRLMMATSDGWHWELEASALESRHHPISSFSYYYQVDVVITSIPPRTT